MVSPGEWVFVAVAIILVVVAFGVLLHSPTRVHSDLVVGSPDQTANDLVLALAEVRNSRVSARTPHILSVDHSFIPGWAIACAIFLFPFGLLALLSRKEIQGAIVVEASVDYPGMTNVRVSGEFTTTAARALERFTSSRALPSYATP